MKKIILIITLIFLFNITTFAEDSSGLSALAHLIMGEAEGCDWETKLAVGSVVLNRVSDSRFPGTIDEVIWQPGQYSPTWDGRYSLEPNEDSWAAAEYLMTYGSQLPEEVVWQAEFSQGNGIYDILDGMYFCF